MGGMDPAQNARSILMERTTRVCSNLAVLRAFDAKANTNADKIAIWWRVIDHWVRNGFNEDHEWVAGKTFEDFVDNNECYHFFWTFDARIGRILAGPLFPVSLENGDLEASLNLLGLGAPCNVANLETLERLGADLSSVEVDTKLMHGRCSLAMVLAHFQQTEALRFVLGRGAPPGASSGSAGWTVLHVSVSQDLPLEVLELELQYGARPDAQDVHGRTPLFDACVKNRLDVIELLLRHGTPLDVKDACGSTAYDWCKTEESRNLLNGYRVPAV